MPGHPKTMPDCLFYIFSALTLSCGAFVVLSRNPVNSAMFLVLSILSLAGLFVLLHAFFLAAVQVIVYAGAVIILFVFVIMLLDLKEEQRRRINAFGAVAGVLSVFAIGFAFWRAFAHSELPPIAGSGGAGKVLSANHEVMAVYVDAMDGTA